MKKLEFDNITNEQWETFRAVLRASREEDLKIYVEDLLEREYMTQDRANEILENKEDIIDRFEELESDFDWREFFDNAVEWCLG